MASSRAGPGGARRRGPPPTEAPQDGGGQPRGEGRRLHQRGGEVSGGAGDLLPAGAQPCPRQAEGPFHLPRLIPGPEAGDVRQPQGALQALALRVRPADETLQKVAHRLAQALARRERSQDGEMCGGDPGAWRGTRRRKRPPARPPRLPQGAHPGQPQVRVLPDGRDYVQEHGAAGGGQGGGGLPPPSPRPLPQGVGRATDAGEELHPGGPAPAPLGRGQEEQQLVDHGGHLVQPEPAEGAQSPAGDGPPRPGAERHPPERREERPHLAP